jgi:hypothetical protein
MQVHDVPEAVKRMGEEFLTAECGYFAAVRWRTFSGPTSFLDEFFPA